MSRRGIRQGRLAQIVVDRPLVMAREATSIQKMVPALALVTLCAVAAVVFSQVGFAATRYLVDVLPLADAVSASLRLGELPEWWPAMDQGTPLAALPHAGALYPPRVLLALGNGATAHDLFIVAHAALAAWGMARWSKALGADRITAVSAAILTVLAGPIVSAVVGPSPLVALAWLPHIGACAAAFAAREESDLAARSRFEVARGIGLAGLLLAAPVLAGSLTIALAGAVIAVVTQLGWKPGRTSWRRWASVGAAVVFGGLISAPAWMPWLLVDVARPMVAATPWQWIGAIAAGGFGSVDQPGWELGRALGGTPLWIERARSASFFVGGGAAVLGLLAVVRGERRVRALAVLAAMMAIGSVVVGDGSPWSGDSLAGVAVLMLLILAAAGLGTVRNQSERRPWYLLAVPAGLSLATFAMWRSGATIADAAARASLRPRLADADAAVGRALVSGWTAAGVALAVAVAVIATQRWRQGRGRQLALIIVAVAAMASMLTGPLSSVSLRSRASIDLAPPLLRARMDSAGRLFRGDLERDDSPLAVRAALPYVGSRFGWSYVRGSRTDDPLFEAVWRAAATLGGRALDVYGIDYAVVPSSVALASGRPVLAADPESGTVLIGNSNRRPRAFVTPRVVFATPRAAVAALFPPAFDESIPFDLGTVYLNTTTAWWAAQTRVQETDLAASRMPRVPIKPCVIEDPSPNRVRVSCDSERGGALVLLDRMSDGWRATADGRPVAVVAADAIVRAVPVGPGPVVAEFRYRTPGLVRALWVSAVSLLGWALIVLFAWVRVRRRGRASSPTE